MGMLTEFLWSMMFFLLAVRIMGVVVKLLSSKGKLQGKTIEEEPMKRSSLDMKKEEKELAIEMVQDMVCGACVPKHKAFQVAKSNEIHHFCSWDCRQKFIAETQEDK